MTKKNVTYQGLSTLEVLIEAKNYNNWIAHEIESYITSPVLEIGAGTGNLTRYFLKQQSLFVTDKDAGLVARLKKMFAQQKNITVQTLDVTKKQKTATKKYFSSIFAINVLEHIEDDEGALRNIHSLLKKKGRLILLVPAKRIAYTKLDRELGHFRRYEKKELVQKLSENGYAVEKIYFFNIVGLISWYVRDKVKTKNINLKPHHIMLFDKIVPFLRFFESLVPMPVGISLIVVARKIG